MTPNSKQTCVEKAVLQRLAGRGEHNRNSTNDDDPIVTDFCPRPWPRRRVRLVILELPSKRLPFFFFFFFFLKTLNRTWVPSSSLLRWMPMEPCGACCCFPAVTSLRPSWHLTYMGLFYVRFWFWKWPLSVFADPPRPHTTNPELGYMLSILVYFFICEVPTVKHSWLRVRSLNTSTGPPSPSLPLQYTPFQFPVQIYWLHQVQRRWGYRSCYPVLCFTCNLIFIQLHFL